MCHLLLDRDATLRLLDRMKQAGFQAATASGISFGKDDIVIPARKAPIVEETRKLVEEYEQQYAEQLLAPTLVL